MSVLLGDVQHSGLMLVSVCEPLSCVETEHLNRGRGFYFPQEPDQMTLWDFCGTSVAIVPNISLPPSLCALLLNYNTNRDSKYMLGS